MNFAFYSPWVWLGALAVIGPVWLHLRRKKERNLVRFPAVRFLDDQPKARRSPLNLRDVALLILRILAVLLIAGAFALPYLRRWDHGFIHRSVVYILDNSMSRQANDGFNQDKQRIIRDLGNSSRSTQVAVFELTGTPRLVSGFEEDRHTAIQKVRELEPSFQRGSYLGAFRAASFLLNQAPGTRQIVFLGDSQANQWQENVAAAPFLKQVQIELPKPAAQQLPNLWLSDPRAQRVFLGEKSRINFTMRLGHLGPARTARVTLKANGQTILERSVDLENQPQNLVLQAQCEADPTSWLQAVASVEGVPDDLPADNHLYFAVPPVVEGRVALLAHSPYLRLALSPDVMRGQWKTLALDPANLARETTPKPEAEVLCIESAFLQSPEGRALLKNYLDAGRGVLLLVNRLSPRIDACLRELGFEPEGLNQPPQSKPEHFQFVFSSHSIFRPFQAADFGNLTDITVSHYAQLRPAAGRPLVLSETGHGLFFESTRYPGKLFVSAFGLDRSETSWPVHPTFIPFLDLALQAARPQDPTVTAFEPGEVAVIQVPAENTASTIVVRENGRHLTEAEVLRGQARVRVPDKPGLYTLSFDNKDNIQRIICINPSPKESELVYLESPKAVEQWNIAERGGTKVRELADTRAVGFSSILNQRIWWWMVLVALLVLGLETSWVVAKESRVA